MVPRAFEDVSDFRKAELPDAGGSGGGSRSLDDEQQEVVIHFYRLGDPYGWMSNFSKHPVLLDEREWPTVEHYYQAMKVTGADQEAVRLAKSPGNAKRLAWATPLRSDWEEVRDSVMLEALRAKFSQHPDLGEALISTGNAKLVERTSNDSYWGDGGDGTGRNRLGELLMLVRSEIGQTAGG